MSDASRQDSLAGPNSKPHAADLRRRRFLMAFGAGAAGAAASAPAVSGPAAVIAPIAAEPEPKGYRESEHVRSYYASTRL
ncbi:MAG TPA: formate dehydrogenase [Casimicrobiaceae bacterium]|nr:formate dehydrogenase [Casimicrobiaceae bacterium]